MPRGPSTSSEEAPLQEVRFLQAQRRAEPWGRKDKAKSLEQLLPG